MNINSRFKGWRDAGTDFGAVRNQFQHLGDYIDIDLSGARSHADGTALILNISGNSIYCDLAETTGKAVFQFQDTAERGGALISVNAGFIANVPFTQICVTHAAQAGLKIRLIYGVDVSFVPGSQYSVIIDGTATVDILQGDTIATPAAVSVGVAATALCAASATRKGVRFYNGGTVTVYLGGAGVTTAVGMPLPAGSTWFESEAAGAAWYAISGTAAQAVRVMEVS